MKPPNKLSWRWKENGNGVLHLKLTAVYSHSISLSSEIATVPFE